MNNFLYRDWLITFYVLYCLRFYWRKNYKKEYLIYFSAVGSIYIVYLALKIWNSTSKVEDDAKEVDFNFKNAFLIQTLNPKSILAVLPIVTIHFPINNITGFKIIIMSTILAILGYFAPFTYSLIGKFLSNLIKNKMFFSIFNKIMAVLLILVAISIFKEHVYLVLIGVNPY
ncbi:MAG: transporter [Firmicutes bacterium]|nr:transporter [Bacillota bacterium]